MQKSIHEPWISEFIEKSTNCRLKLREWHLVGQAIHESACTSAICDSGGSGAVRVASRRLAGARQIDWGESVRAVGRVAKWQPLTCWRADEEDGAHGPQVEPRHLALYLAARLGCCWPRCTVMAAAERSLLAGRTTGTALFHCFFRCPPPAGALRCRARAHRPRTAPANTPGATSAPAAQPSTSPFSSLAIAKKLSHFFLSASWYSKHKNKEF